MKVENLPSWTVPAAQGAIRLDTFVRRCFPHLSLREVKKAIEERAFWVNERPGRKGDRLFGGEVLTLRGSPHLLARSPLPAPDLTVPILFEDRSVLALDKPAGVATHGFSGRETKTLANFLAAFRPSLRAVGKSRWEPGLVHRLDRGTSGIVLVAKDQGSFENLRSQFRRGLIEKKYWALVWGTTSEKEVIASPLIHDPADRRRMRTVTEERGKRNQARKWPASTRYRLLRHSKGFSLLEIEMETGVTHQIRVHLEAIGHPLVGDPLYGGDRPDPFALGRQFLHAFYLRFRHPGSGEDVSIESPLPKELREVLDSLSINL
ncbi:MAG: RluA family pseudouridine synthase [Candidatus Binatia bacterium]